MSWLKKAQASLQHEKISTWIIYDFRATNPIAKEYLKLDEALSRRVFCIIPQTGQATLLVNQIDRAWVKKPDMIVRTYSSRQSLELLLTDLVPKAKVALEYSPNNAIPGISYVDGGIIELIRSVGAEVVSSAPLLQALSLWSKEQINAHLRAAEHLNLAKDLAFDYISLHAPMGKSVRESDVQKVLSDYFDRYKLSYVPPVVSFARNTTNPNYITKLGSDAVLKEGDVVVIDIWAKIAYGDSPYATICWSAVYGEPSGQAKTIWEALKGARNLVIKDLSSAYQKNIYPKGCDIDKRAREYIRQKGFEKAFIHRTGHSLGIKNRQGDAAHIDDFETHDTRLLSPGFGLTVEPGIYLESFGMRSKINLFLDPKGPKITTAIQEELVSL